MDSEAGLEAWGEGILVESTEWKPVLSMNKWYQCLSKRANVKIPLNTYSEPRDEDKVVCVLSFVHHHALQDLGSVLVFCTDL